MYRVNRIHLLLVVLLVGLGFTVSVPASAATACWQTEVKKCCDINKIPDKEIPCSLQGKTWTCTATITQDDNVDVAVKKAIGWPLKKTVPGEYTCAYTAAKCNQYVVGRCDEGAAASSTCTATQATGNSNQCDSRFASIGCDPNDVACLMAFEEGCGGPEEEEPPCDPAQGCEEPPPGI